MNIYMQGEQLHSVSLNPINCLGQDDMNLYVGSKNGK